MRSRKIGRGLLQDGQFPFFQIDDLIRMVQKGQDVRGDKNFSLPQADDQGALPAYRHHPLGMPLLQNHQSEGSPDLLQGPLYRLHQV